VPPPASEALAAGPALEGGGVPTAEVGAAGEKLSFPGSLAMAAAGAWPALAAPAGCPGNVNPTEGAPPPAAASATAVAAEMRSGEAGLSGEVKTDCCFWAEGCRPVVPLEHGGRGVAMVDRTRCLEPPPEDPCPADLPVLVLSSSASLCQAALLLLLLAPGCTSRLPLLLPVEVPLGLRKSRPPAESSLAAGSPGVTQCSLLLLLRGLPLRPPALKACG
jgi:hypothetical protein